MQHARESGVTIGFDCRTTTGRLPSPTGPITPLWALFNRFNANSPSLLSFFLSFFLSFLLSLSCFSSAPPPPLLLSLFFFFFWNSFEFAEFFGLAVGDHRLLPNRSLPLSIIQLSFKNCSSSSSSCVTTCQLKSLSLSFSLSLVSGGGGGGGGGEGGGGGLLLLLVGKWNGTGESAAAGAIFLLVGGNANVIRVVSVPMLLLWPVHAGVAHLWHHFHLITSSSAPLFAWNQSQLIPFGNVWWTLMNLPSRLSLSLFISHQLLLLLLLLVLPLIQPPPTSIRVDCISGATAIISTSITTTTTTTGSCHDALPTQRHHQHDRYRLIQFGKKKSEILMGI